MNIEHSLELDVIIEQIKQYCSFSLGQEIIENLSPDFHHLSMRLENERSSNALQATIAYGPMPFYGLRDLRLCLSEAKKGKTLLANELNAIASQIYGTKEVKSYTDKLETEKDALNDLVNTLVLHQKLEKEIRQCISEDGQVKDEASSALKEIRKELMNIDSVIHQCAQSFISKHKDQVVDEIITYRNERAVVLVRAQDKNTFGGYVYGDSASGQASYVEPKELIGPNNRKQELIHLEKEEVHRILTSLSQLVSNDSDELLANLETLGILDALFAKAIWGQSLDCVLPTLVEEKRISILQARHPLIDPKLVVANDYQLGPEQKMLLITGPNTGGKTVSLKIIGLFVLMSACGIPLPCKEATIPFFDQIFVDIGDDQSVVSSLSSFSAHIQKVAEVIDHATSESLVLLDEIGSGTDPTEGESLAIAVLNELRQRETMTVATTHYSRLKAFGKRHDDILVASVQFDLDELKPTYRYLEGVTGQSNALDVARRYGLSDSIVKYAQFLKKQAKSEEDELIDRLELQLQQNVLLQEELESKKEELETKLKELEHQTKLLEQQKEHFQDEVEAQKESILEEARNEADEILSSMRLMQENAKYHEVLEKRNELYHDEEIPEDKDEEFEVGDVIELKQSNQLGKVISLRKKDLVIEVNGREIVVKKNQIRHTDRILVKEKANTNFSVVSHHLKESMPLECNLIGCHVDEATERLQDYLADVKIHRLPTFRVIHGDGSGALRKAVHAILSKDKSVESFRMGMPQEGGTGATVVKMKE